MAGEAGQANMAADRLPVRFECPACLYDLGGAESRRCPECGRDVTDADIGAFQAREGAASVVREIMPRHLLVLGVVCGVMALGAGILTRSITVVFEAGGACCAALAGSLLIGWLASRAGRPADRAAYFLIWLRTYLWLQVGWLCIPVCAAVILGAAMAFPSDEKLNGTTVAFGFVGFMCWLVVQVACAFAWAAIFNTARVGIGLRMWRARGAFVVAALVVLGGSFGLGFMGGIAAFAAAGDLARKHSHAAP